MIYFINNNYYNNTSKFTQLAGSCKLGFGAITQSETESVKKHVPTDLHIKAKRCAKGCCFLSDKYAQIL